VLGSRRSRPSVHHHLPPTAAAAGDTVDGTSGSVLTTASISSSVSGGASARSAKDELRARLSHRPASDPALHRLSHVGKDSFVIYMP